MLSAVWIAGVVLAAVAVTDRRARTMLAVLVLALVQTAISDAVLDDRLWEIAMRTPIDAGCCVLAIMLVSKDWMTRAVPALFIAMLLSHAAFWLSRWNGHDVWDTYSNGLNALWLMQLVVLAWPTGGYLIGRAISWIGYLRHDGIGSAGVGVKPCIVAVRHESPDGEGGSGLRAASAAIYQRGANTSPSESLPCAAAR